MFEIYKGKRVFVTGHTGFEGGRLTLWLQLLGAKVTGYSLLPSEEDGFYNATSLGNCCESIIGDIRDYDSLKKAVSHCQPEFIFHLAAQPLVRRSYHEPIQTYETNVIGTLNLLEAARSCKSLSAFVNVTTDKCYENFETGKACAEGDPLGGHDMYSSSKACAEIMSASYRRSFLCDGFNLATARAGNVIGGGDRGEDRLVPDCIRSLEKGTPVRIRNPQSVRPWQFVLEPLSGYLRLGEKLAEVGQKYAQAFNFGPEETLDVAKLASALVEYYGSGELEFPAQSQSEPHEAGLLRLDSSKSRNMLGWAPKYSTLEAIKQTVNWYKAYAAGRDMREFSLEQIQRYTGRI